MRRPYLRRGRAWEYQSPLRNLTLIVLKGYMSGRQVTPIFPLFFFYFNSNLHRKSLKTSNLGKYYRSNFFAGKLYRRKLGK